MPEGKGHRAALKLEFSLTGMNLAASTMLSKMFHIFEMLCPPLEI